jgi:hypothetical protein
MNAGEVGCSGRVCKSRNPVHAGVLNLTDGEGVWGNHYRGANRSNNVESRP